MVSLQKSFFLSETFGFFEKLQISDTTYRSCKNTACKAGNLAKTHRNVRSTMMEKPSKLVPSGDVSE